MLILHNPRPLITYSDNRGAAGRDENNLFKIRPREKGRTGARARKREKGRRDEMMGLNNCVIKILKCIMFRVAQGKVKNLQVNRVAA